MSDGFRSQWSWLSWVLVTIVVVAGLIFGAVDDTPPLSDGERASKLASSIRCPQCTGQSVAESDVPIARSIRAEIAEAIDDGRSDDEIRQSFVDVYGESILLTPSGEGFVSLVWIVPVVAACAAAAALALAFARWRGELTPASGSTEVTAEDEALVAAARRADMAADDPGAAT